MFLCFFDGHYKSESHRKLQTFELERHICRNHWNCSFDDIAHLVTCWILSHLVINLFGRAHYNYAKFHYNLHRVQLITWSVVTWSLRHLVTYSLREFNIYIYRFDDIVHHIFHWSLGHLVTWSLVIWSLVTWSLGHLVTLSLGPLDS
jgi:hypothetical protein